MQITIEVSDERYEQLQQKARRNGVSVEQQIEKSIELDLKIDASNIQAHGPGAVPMK